MPATLGEGASAALHEFPELLQRVPDVAEPMDYEGSSAALEGIQGERLCWGGALHWGEHVAVIFMKTPISEFCFWHFAR